MRYVAFLRAVNVGGRIVKMDVLRRILEKLGLSHVSTFIASGNVIFESPADPIDLELAIESTLKKALGYDVTTMVRSMDDVAAILGTVRKRQLTAVTGVTLYVGVLKATPSRGAARAVLEMSNEVDSLLVIGREVYWRCQKAFSDSTVSGPRLEKVLGTPATFRNFNTVQKIAAKYAVAPKL
ncbi:MAG TPA: DUF1697 domain-containing protein [Gemmatimonadaceae bacterium]|nr:DUF1697 domain-containing protein [Gemmatimonadaceae bacterium]